MKIIKPEARNILKNAKNKTFLYKNKTMAAKRPEILGFYKGKTTKSVYFFGGVLYKNKTRSENNKTRSSKYFEKCK